MAMNIAAEIYYPLEEHVTALVTTDIARAIVDLNRAEDDNVGDQVDVKIYRDGETLTVPVVLEGQ